MSGIGCHLLIFITGITIHLNNYNIVYTNLIFSLNIAVLITQGGTQNNVGFSIKDLNDSFIANFAWYN